jgi:hypothetical protein
MTCLLLAYLASLPLEASDLEAPDFVSLELASFEEEEVESDAGADEFLPPFPLAGGVPDFLA